jgi:diguanylate cyclase (GGDEF)-like protein
VAERIQKHGNKHLQMDGQMICSTVSIGGTEAHYDDKSFEDVLRRADRLLYKAKGSGKNRVALE